MAEVSPATRRRERIWYFGSDVAMVIVKGKVEFLVLIKPSKWVVVLRRDLFLGV